MTRPFALAALCACLATGCAVYTFSGSTLPGHLKTVDVPLFANQSLQPQIADDITSALTTRVVSDNLLKVVSGRGDATIAGTIRSYENQEYFYDVTQVRSATITDYVVRIVVDVEFTDNKKSATLYKGTITGQGIYKFATEKESDGIARAEKDVVDQIMQNSVQSW
jgi:hypothetical protein